MVQATSDHIRPCNIGKSEEHNRRAEDYIARINKSRLYIRLDLTPQNRSWISPQMQGMDLQAYLDSLARMVKEKTGRTMRTDEVLRVNKLTGTTMKVRGCTPLREGVVVCSAETTMEQLQDYARACHEQWGITALQIHIHRDEGHYIDPTDPQSWKPNYHAHIVWDWMDHRTGRSIKLDKQDMSHMQDLLAQCLGMQRGKSRDDTKAAHLERGNFVLAQQRKETEELARQQASAEAERDAARREAQSAQRLAEEAAEEEGRNRQQIAEHRQELADLDRQLRLAQRRVKGLTTMVQNKEQELRALQETLERLDRQLAEGRGQMADLRQQREDLIARIHLVRNSLQEKEEKLRTAEQQLSALEEAIRHSEQRRQAIDQRSAELSRDVHSKIGHLMNNIALTELTNQYSRLAEHLTPEQHELFDPSILNLMAQRGKEVMHCATLLFIGMVNDATAYATSHGGGGTSNDLPWGRDPDDDNTRWAARCLRRACKMMKPRKGVRRHR